MKIKLIASDLDGTLLAPDHFTITPRTEKALTDAQSKGVKIAVATGRTLDFMDDAVKRLPFMDYAVYSNGASILDAKKGKLVYKNHVPPAVLARAVKFLENRPIYYQVYAEGKVFARSGGEKIFGFLDMPEKFLKYLATKITVCDDLPARLAGVSAEILEAFPLNGRSEREIADYLKSEGFVTTSSVKGEIAASAPGASKGTALAELCSRLGIDPGEVMAFGDAENDSSMLEFAGYSFAMDNGSEGCKRTAEFIAPSNALDGVARTIEKYAL